ncbi:AraC family transcriptional regulator [Photobacterium angustum]|uniref:AraC family transcriptional regulator n=1 Tax=Photobacterium angustum TaxID=661 RepID=UPI0005E1BA0E|nr:helix-turn-helix transcriptional regulator [Photobacterium angustum]KJG16351.1 AraC family transcriptional regulator [Photobacterium angustum]KJG22398.1 AraC family transcriptional regulator [Photobacterium angustum]KJG28805.1 AraC family transcriptional regulator [Photobacterium angustum]PSW96259.1 AraC family transcriptional regulator [Photobacterium angustum]PSX02184.1 AraC family transcriptional regulator [Photobacterium angustum]
MTKNITLNKTIPSFDSDSYSQKAVAMRFSRSDVDEELPFHTHRKGQLVLPLSGCVRCKIANAIWMVPTNCAVWIPSQVPHSLTISDDIDICNLFIEPDVIGLPEKACTLSVSPLLRELIVKLAELDQFYEDEGNTARLVDVLIYELSTMPSEQFDFPIPEEPRLQKIALALIANPSDRSTVSEWASKYAMSERTLARLVKQELGLTFGNWRGQLHIVIALQKLSSGEPVQRISEDLGYESVSAFITFFKRTLGRPPKQYIKKRVNV